MADLTTECRRSDRDHPAFALLAVDPIAAADHRLNYTHDLPNTMVHLTTDRRRSDLDHADCALLAAKPSTLLIAGSITRTIYQVADHC
jgi:hypothetical protein